MTIANGRYLLDTNIIIAIFANDSSILLKLANLDNIFIPSIVVGELYYGAYNSTRINENIEKIESFINQNVILEANTETAKYYGQVKAQLKKKGHPIPENDVWIAAFAKQHHLILLTKDKHFEVIENLLLEKV